MLLNTTKASQYLNFSPRAISIENSNPTQKATCHQAQSFARLPR